MWTQWATSPKAGKDPRATPSGFYTEDTWRSKSQRAVMLKFSLWR